MKPRNNRKRGGSLLRAALLAIAVTLAPGSGLADQVESVTLAKSPEGDVLTIRTDAALAYRVFDLEGPARTVVSFPGADLAEEVAPLRSEEPGVQAVFATRDEDGVRVEINLDRSREYEIEEQGNRLVVRYAAAEEEGAAKTAATLKDLQVRDRGSVTELVLRGDRMDSGHNAIITNEGQTLILDFWGADSKLPKEFYQFSTQRVSAVTVGQAEGRVRLVAKLLPTARMRHQIEAGANRLVVKLGGMESKRRADAVRVEGVDFQPAGERARLVIRTDEVGPVFNQYEKEGAIVVDLERAELAEGLERTLDVRDFPGPIAQIDTYTVDNMVRVAARLREEVEVSSFQKGNLLTVTFEPQRLARARAGADREEEIAYTGQKVTFDFKDIDIRNALKLIAEMSDLNIIMSDDVKGTLTMRLVDVPWDQALDLILTARGLGKEQVGNVMRIAPVEVLRAEYQSKLEARKGSQQLEPLITEFVTLSFTRVEDVKEMLEGASANTTRATGQPAEGQGGSTSESSVGLLSPRGSFLVDERTNTLIIKDTEKSVNNIKRLISVIDKPVEQVLIEARIVEANDNFTRELGVSWGGTFTKQRKNHIINVAPPTTNRTNIDTLIDNAINNSTNPIEHGPLVDLPAASAATSGGALGLSIGTLTGKVLDLELSAAEADDDVKIISNPRVVTTNLKTAVMEQGTDIPFTTVSQNGTQTEFKKATLGMEVTPQITADDRVILHVVVNKDTPVAKQQNSAIDTKRIDTEIFMDNGETVVIGGIYTRDQSKNVAGVPGLSKIPLLGWLFKKQTKTDNRSELLIFITPTIIQSGSSNLAAREGG